MNRNNLQIPGLFALLVILFSPYLTFDNYSTSDDYTTKLIKWTWGQIQYDNDDHYSDWHEIEDKDEIAVGEEQKWLINFPPPTCF